MLKYTLQNFQVFTCEEEEGYSYLNLGYGVETMLAFLYIIAMIILLKKMRLLLLYYK